MGGIVSHDSTERPGVPGEPKDRKYAKAIKLEVISLQ